MKTPEGITAKTPEENAKIFAEHFEKNVFSRLSNYDKTIIDELPRTPTNHNLGKPPTFEEFSRAISSLNNGKSPGISQIPAEALKTMTDENANIIYELVLQFWNNKDIDFLAFHQVLLKILPKKGDLTDPNSWRGIALQEVVSKVLSCIISERMQTFMIKNFARDSQYGFTNKRGG